MPRPSAKKLTNDRYEQIKGYVTFRVSKRKQTPYQQRKVREYHQLLLGKRTIETNLRTGEKEYSGTQGLLSRPVYHLKGLRSKSSKELARKYSSTPKGYSQLKGYLIPVAKEGDKPKITFTKGRGKRNIMEVEEDRVSRTFYAFEDYETDELLVTDQAGELVQRIISKTRKNRKNKQARFKIQCGKSLSENTFGEDQIAEEVQRYYDTYKDVGEWCTGIEEFTYKADTDYKDYAKKEKASRKAKQKANAKLRAKLRKESKRGKNRKKRENNSDD